MEAAIRVENLVKTFDGGQAEVLALDRVDFRADPGELVLLMGPSGSGKTTLLSIMGCILPPTSGRVVVAGQEAAGLPEAALSRIRKAHLGFIFQAYNLFPSLTARQNVMVALDLKGVSRPRARALAADLLERVGLGARLDKHPATLSGGEKQRVAIARALAGDPGIILADEPTGALDSGNGRLVMELLRDLSLRRGRAVVVVTHDSRAEEYANRIVRIEDGRIRHD